MLVLYAKSFSCQKGTPMSRALFVKPNPFSEALAGFHCGALPVFLLGSFVQVTSQQEFLLYLFLGMAVSLALMHWTGELHFQFALPCIGIYAVGLGLITKSISSDSRTIVMVFMLCALFYVALTIAEIVWKRHNA